MQDKSEVVRQCRDNQGEEVVGWTIFCPGCRERHHVRKGMWTFNGDMLKPTFSPSILVGGVVPITDEEADRIMAGEVIKPVPRVCHSFVRDGRIEFLGDCTHELAGQTVGLEPF